jgi:hypothetical protein
MNILFTSVGDFLTFESQECLREWAIRFHNVERMSFERAVAYLRLDPASALALVDAIVCIADTDMIAYSENRHFPALDSPIEKALVLAKSVRDLPKAVPCWMDASGGQYRIEPPRLSPAQTE